MNASRRSILRAASCVIHAPRLRRISSGIFSICLPAVLVCPLLGLLAAPAVCLADASDLFGAPTPSATAGRKDEASVHFKRGTKLFEESDFNAALAEFKRAYDLQPNGTALYNIAETYFQLADYAHALPTFERYLLDGGTKIPASRRKEVEREIEELKTRVARIAVKTNPGADISIDDSAVGVAPLRDAILVSAGRRKITVTKDGKSASKVVEIAGGDAVSVEVLVSRPTIDDPVKKTVVATPPPKMILPAILWVGAGVLTASAVTFGALTLSAQSKLADERGRFGATSSDLDSAASRTRQFALGTDILGVLALGTVGAALWVTLSTASPKKDSVAVQIGPGSVALSGRF